MGVYKIIGDYLYYISVNRYIKGNNVFLFRENIYSLSKKEELYCTPAIIDIVNSTESYDSSGNQIIILRESHKRYDYEDKVIIIRMVQKQGYKYTPVIEYLTPTHALLKNKSFELTYGDGRLYHFSECGSKISLIYNKKKCGKEYDSINSMINRTNEMMCVEYYDNIFSITSSTVITEQNHTVKRLLELISSTNYNFVGKELLENLTVHKNIHTVVIVNIKTATVFLNSVILYLDEELVLLNVSDNIVLFNTKTWEIVYNKLITHDKRTSDSYSYDRVRNKIIVLNDAAIYHLE
jgi:hypothetical protein